MTKEELIQFEEEVKELYLEGKIKAPIHLSGGGEELLIEIFREIKKSDWVFSTYRSHYHALLRGVDRSWLRNEILNGRSMHINSREHNFFTSSIAGGCLPIALGVAMAIKRKGEDRKVWCFVGDMASHMGVAYECITYARNHNLPLCVVIEDNELSVNTPTREVWGIKYDPPLEDKVGVTSKWSNGRVLYYRYTRKFPHQGCGVWVSF